MLDVAFATPLGHTAAQLVKARAFRAPSNSKPAASSAQLIAAAQAALREKTDAEKPAEVSAFEAEWTSEIIDEIEPDDDQGERRLPAVPSRLRQ